MASSLRILHVFPAFQPGGQQSRLVSLAGALADEVSHIVVSLDGDFSARELAPDSVAVEYVPFILKKSSAFSLGNIKGLRKLLQAHQPDVLCTYNWGSIEAVIANKAGVAIPHFHYEDGFGPDEAIDRQKATRVRARRLLLTASQIVVPSQTLERLALDVWRLDPSRLHRIANGIDLEKFAINREIGLTGGQGLRVGSMGALRPEKNFPRLVRAFAAAKKPPATRLVIVGDGPDLAPVRAAAKAAGICSELDLPGRTATPERCYPDFDIFAISSDTEQMPIGLMEAMASGAPVVATDVGDVKEMVSEENRHFITPAGDEAALSQSLQILLKDPEQRIRLGAANAAKAKCEFALEDMVGAHHALWRMAAGVKGAKTHRT